jgi:outer membrane receptor protein involved in Fe transport
MNTVDFGKLHVNTGLRIEATRDLTFGYNLTFYRHYQVGSYIRCPLRHNCLPTATNCYTVQGVNNNPSYIDLLPSVQRAIASPQLALRAVYSRGVPVPIPISSFPTSPRTRPPAPIAVTIGNPSLRPEHANNYDLLYEDYLRRWVWSRPASSSSSSPRRRFRSPFPAA